MRRPILGPLVSIVGAGRSWESRGPEGGAQLRCPHGIVESLETSDQCRWDPTSSEFIQLARNPGYQNPFILSLWEVWSFRVWNQKSSKEWYATLFLIIILSRYFGFFCPKDDHRTVEEPLLYFLRQLFRQLRIEATGLEHHELIGFFLWGNPKSSKIA